MDCNQVQRHFNEFKIGQTSESVACEIQQHLKDCTDCRVQKQRAARLQQLLAIKRYENPSQEYFDGFLTEFHKRLDEGSQQPVSLWQQFVDHFQDFRLPIVRYRYAGGFAVLIAIMCMWGGLQLMDAHTSSRETLFSPKAAQNTMASTLPVPNPSTSYYSDLSDPFHSKQVANLFSQESETDANPPDYILESIIPTPVNYEVDSVHF